MGESCQQHGFVMISLIVRGARCHLLIVSCAFALMQAAPIAGPLAQTGPDTEKRFPSLHVPDGFRVTLFACDPLVEYPSSIALGPGPGSVFVAQDYLTGLVKEIVKKDEIRLLVDSDGDGYADQTSLYAGAWRRTIPIRSCVARVLLHWVR